MMLYELSIFETSHRAGRRRQRRLKCVLAPRPARVRRRELEALLPIPLGNLERPIEAAWHWPEARRVFAKHAARGVVFASSDSLTPAMLALTEAVASVANGGGASGDYYGNASPVLPAERSARVPLARIIHEAERFWPGLGADLFVKPPRRPIGRLRRLFSISTPILRPEALSAIRRLARFASALRYAAVLLGSAADLVNNAG